MGKLRLTFISLLFFVIIFLSCFLAENFAFYSSTQLDGLNRSSTLLIAALIILLLIIYYFVEHKKNGLKFDKILLPIVLVCSLLLVLTVLWQGPLTVTTTNGANVLVKFSAIDKTIIILQIVIWMAVLYAILFVNNRYNVIKNVALLFVGTYFVFIFVSAISDVFYEWSDLIAIFNGTYSKNGFSFIIYNPNVWGMLLLLGQLSCYVLSKKRFTLFFYLVSIFFFISDVMTTCSTTVFIGAVLLIAYTAFEAFTFFRKKDNKKSVVLLSSFFGAIAFIAILSTILYQSKVTGFVNLWNYIIGDIFLKDYGSMTHRTSIWKEVFKLITANPISFIFGLGFKTGNVYLKTVNGFRSAHNGYIEVFLRHGLLGLFIYLAALGLFVYSLVILLKKKQYRFSFIYGVCFLALLVHAVTESTVFFAPNIQGCFLTLGFYLPVVNVLQEKHFASLKEDTKAQEMTLDSNRQGKALPCLASILLGLGIAFVIASGTCLDKRFDEVKYFFSIGMTIVAFSIFVPYLLFNVRKDKPWWMLLINYSLIVLLLTGSVFVLLGSTNSLNGQINDYFYYLMPAVILVSSCILFVIEILLFKFKTINYFNDYFVPTIRTSFFSIMITVALGILATNFINSYFLINTFCSIVIALGAFMTYVFAYFIINHTYQDINLGYNRLLLRLYK